MDEAKLRPYEDDLGNVFEAKCPCLGKSAELPTGPANENGEPRRFTRGGARGDVVLLPNVAVSANSELFI